MKLEFASQFELVLEIWSETQDSYVVIWRTFWLSIINVACATILKSIEDKIVLFWRLAIKNIVKAIEQGLTNGLRITQLASFFILHMVMVVFIGFRICFI